MLSPEFSRSWLALVSAVLLLAPGIALFLDAPIYLMGIDGEETWGFLFLAAPTFLLGIVGLALALINRARFRPFGMNEKEF